MMRKRISLIKIEKLLAPRLHFIGIVLLCCSLLTLLYVFFASPHRTPEASPLPFAMETSIATPPEEIPFFTATEEDIARCYVIAPVFSILGILLMIIAKRKKTLINASLKEKQKHE